MRRSLILRGNGIWRVRKGIEQRTGIPVVGCGICSLGIFESPFEGGERVIVFLLGCQYFSALDGKPHKKTGIVGKVVPVGDDRLYQTFCHIQESKIPAA